MNHIQRILVFVAYAILVARASAPRSASGQPPDPSVPTTFELTVSPASEPSPALRYLLIPGYVEKQPGNAASHYRRAIAIWKAPDDIEESLIENEERWLQKWPLDEATRTEMEEWLNQQNQQAFDELRIGTHCDDCDWGVPMRDLRGLDPINILLPEVQGARELGKALRLRVRVALAKGELEGAIDGLRQGYQLSRHVGEFPTLVGGLVGVSIANIMNEEFRHLVEDPAAPNLYWAVAALPHPLVDFRLAMEQERNTALQIFPILKEAETAEYTPQQWRQKLNEAVHLLMRLSSESQSPDSEWADALLTVYMALQYQNAKQQLIASGMPAETIEAMPVAQVVLIQVARATQIAYDEMFKWSYLPYGDAQQHMAKAEQKLIREGYLGPLQVQSKSPLPIAALLLPAVTAASNAPLRLERNLAAMQTVEAIRMYAAENHGELPESLDHIEQVPMTRDPLTSEPIQYRREGDAAILDLPPPEGKSAAHFGFRYIVRIRK